MKYYNYEIALNILYIIFVKNEKRAHMNRLMTAYPLFVKDPNFSFWLSGDYLNKDKVIHWAGDIKNFLGYIEYENKKYRFLGSDNNIEEIKQIDLCVDLMSTHFVFQNDDLELTVSFTSPLPLDDILLLSNPCCFFEYNIKPKRKIDEIKLSLCLGNEIAYSTVDYIRKDIIKVDNKEIVYFGLEKQQLLVNSADYVYPQSGYYYLMSDICDLLDNDYAIKGMNIHKGIDKEINGKILFGVDDVCSIYYYGEILNGYYFDVTKNSMFSCLIDTFNRYEEIKNHCTLFSNKVIEDAIEFGPDYVNIIKSSYMQSIAAHKLVRTRDGRILFLSKENGSDGCIATVDVTYPVMPLFLIYNPKLIEGMLTPIFDFSRMSVWEFPFAPHDAGVYPYCLGQFYAIYNKDSKYQKSITFRKDDYGVLPRYFEYPKGMNIYNYDKQMPVEESSNMLIVSYLLFKETNNIDYISKNIDLLNTWANYLISKDILPESQLCTDDFAGHTKGNINLAIKAIVGIKAYGKLLNALNKDGNSYIGEANRRRDLLLKEVKNGILPLNKDSNLFSLKYNLLADLMCETNLFNSELSNNEKEVYINEMLEYGIPLDGRNSYSKTDWQIWISAIYGNSEFSKEIYKRINKYICSSIIRIPFSDFYDCIEGKPIYYEEHKAFINRPVQGGCFAPIYLKKIKGGC